MPLNKPSVCIRNSPYASLASSRVMVKPSNTASLPRKSKPWFLMLAWRLTSSCSTLYPAPASQLPCRIRKNLVVEGVVSVSSNSRYTHLAGVRPSSISRKMAIWSTNQGWGCALSASLACACSNGFASRVTLTVVTGRSPSTGFLAPYLFRHSTPRCCAQLALA